MKYMIRKSTELFTGHPYGNRGHAGSASDAILDCGRAKVIPGRIYLTKGEALYDCGGLEGVNPVGFVVEEISESAIVLQKILPVLKAIVSHPDFEKAMSNLDITAKPLFKEADEALRSEGINIV